MLHLHRLPPHTVPHQEASSSSNNISDSNNSSSSRCVHRHRCMYTLVPPRRQLWPPGPPLLLKPATAEEAPAISKHRLATAISLD